MRTPSGTMCVVAIWSVHVAIGGNDRSRRSQKNGRASLEQSAVGMYVPRSRFGLRFGRARPRSNYLGSVLGVAMACHESQSRRSCMFSVRLARFSTHVLSHAVSLFFEV